MKNRNFIHQKKLLLVSFIALQSLTFISCSKITNKNEQIKLKLSWWGSDERANYTLNGLRIFEDKNPNIRIQADYTKWAGCEEKFQWEYENNELADVMQINFNWLYKYSEDGEGFYDLYQLSDYIDFNNFTTEDLFYGERIGKLNGVPIAFNTIVPVYDRYILNKYNLKIPQTWDDLFKAAEILKKDGYYPMGAEKNHLFLLLIAHFEQIHKKQCFISNTKFNLSLSEIQEILQFYKELVEKKVILSPSKTFNKDVFRTNKFAGVICWCSESSIYADYIVKKNGIPSLGNFILTPNSDEGGWYLKPATLYAIKKDTKYPKEAAELVNFLLNDPNFALLQKCEKGIPTSNSSLSTIMQNRVLDSLQYDALMKIRFNTKNIHIMQPVLEDKTHLTHFFSFADSYVENKISLEEASKEIFQYFSTL